MDRHGVHHTFRRPTMIGATVVAAMLYGCCGGENSLAPVGHHVIGHARSRYAIVG